jgi:hypothetical protein
MDSPIRIGMSWIRRLTMNFSTAGGDAGAARSGVRPGERSSFC